MPSARPRGTIVTLWSGSRPGTLRLTSAWPASWYAVRRRSSSESTMLLRSRPSITLSLASSRSFMSTAPLLRRAAGRAPPLPAVDRPAPRRPPGPFVVGPRLPRGPLPRPSPPAGPGPAGAPAGVVLFDEDVAGGGGLPLLEQVAHPCRPPPHDHPHEARP